MWQTCIDTVLGSVDLSLYQTNSQQPLLLVDSFESKASVKVIISAFQLQAELEVTMHQDVLRMLMQVSFRHHRSLRQVLSQSLESALFVRSRSRRNLNKAPRLTLSLVESRNPRVMGNVSLECCASIYLSVFTCTCT
jgi:hypothetical protein